MADNMWRIAAGRGGRHAHQFLSDGIISLGWHELGDVTRFQTSREMMEKARQVFPESTERKIQVGVSQVWRFLTGISIGDAVVTYQPSERLYHLGRVIGEPRYSPGVIEEMELSRAVTWETSVSRDSLSARARNSLGAIQTLIRVPDEVARELLSEPSSSADPAEAMEADVFGDPYAELFEQSVQRVQDKILALDWSQLQDLVAALLRALGYRTIVSPAGADRGRDIIASRDGFGFERPRIVVEVKHRRDKMGAPEIRSFIGGRHVDDRGLYVSTGGFSQEARYEAERAATVTHLMDLEGLARAVVEQYDAFDEQGRALLPLRRLYWPSDG